LVDGFTHADKRARAATDSIGGYSSAGLKISGGGSVLFVLSVEVASDTVSPSISGGAAPLFSKIRLISSDTDL
jgi:hypothetical protein